MARWTVYTDAGDYTGIWARSAAHAKSIVWELTMGRAKTMDAVREA